MKSILVIGCGSIGERHLRCFQKTSRAQPVACDTRRDVLERMGETYGVSTSLDFKMALEGERYAGAVICTPAQSHLAVASYCLAKDVPILIEKPLSTRLEGTAELLDEIHRAGVFAAVAYVYHSIPCVFKAREFLRAGSLGRPLLATVTAGQHFPTFRPAYRDIYYNNHDTGGGAIQDALTHLFNAVEWLVDAPTTRISCEADHQALPGVEVEDTVAAAARNGHVVVSYALNQFQAPNETTVAVHCEQGSLVIEVHLQRWKVFARESGEWVIHDEPVSDRDDMFVGQANAFLDGIEGKSTGLCSVEEAVQTLKVNLAALRSAANGETVSIS